MQERIPGKSVTGTGASTGIFTTTSTTGLAAGAKGFLRKSDNTLNQYAMIVTVIDATTFTLRFLPEGTDDVKLRTGAVKHPYYGLSSLSAYSAGSIFSFEAQLVDVQQPQFTTEPTTNL
jgi:hypothetical protein